MTGLETRRLAIAAAILLGFGGRGFGAESASQAPAPAAAAPAPASTVNAPLGWATTYLLAQAFTAEYQAAKAASDAGILFAPAKIGPPAPGAAEPMASLRTRAAFARLTAASRGQTLVVDPRLTAELAATGWTPPTDEAAGRAAVRATLAASSAPVALTAAWDALTPTFAAPTPSCPLSVEEIRGFASHQRQLAESGREGNPNAVLAAVAGWSVGKARCLAFALMTAHASAKAQGGFEPLPLLLAWRQTGSPMARDAAVTALTATRLLQGERYAEALGTLMELVDKDSAYRLAYEVVQRIYSLRQRGDGAVALKGP